MSEVIRLQPDAAPEEQDRFHRFSLIGWWDQKKLAAAKVVVIGAGALGNEIIKNLALLGIGNLFIADKDRIENSNLSRSVLYRESDAGEFKATVAARAAKQIYPQMNVAYFNGDIIHDLGLGVFHWADLVIGGLDNREARLSINRACWKVNRPWIDGAIEQIQGVARVFVPDSASAAPCYECTMSQRDWQLLQLRRSCNLLTREEMERGKTPTTPTISSIIAGVQCQEAVKLLHGMDTISGKGWVFQGLSTDSYQTEYQRKPDCYSHDTLDEIISLDATTNSMTARELLYKAATIGGSPVELDLNRDILEKLVCPQCKQEELLYQSLGKVKSDRALCPTCKTVRREVVTFNKIRGDEPFLDRKLSEIGIPPFDVVTIRAGGKSIGLEFSSDAESVLGSLTETGLDFV
jgi:molybdopterin/thiamine biosynthesis adenylyltransferase